MKTSALLFLGLGVLLECALLAEQQAATKAETGKAKLRERLRQQFNLILETRAAERGLIVNISDTLFETDKSTLKPGGREKLAKVAGILLAYPGLKVQLEGHTERAGSDEGELKLFEQRAFAVRDYLAAQGIPSAALSPAAPGKAEPAASSDSAPEKQQSPRLDLVISGEPIGMGDMAHPAARK